MKIHKTLNILGMAVLAAGMSVNAASAASYSDVNAGDWYYDYVTYVSDKGIMTGLNETTFGPAENLVRAQFTTILYRMAGAPQASSSVTFADVTGGEWYYDAVAWASEAGIVTGYTTSNTFEPGKAITREEIATMMHRFADYEWKETEAGSNLALYPDGSSVSKFADKAMQWAVAHEMIQGKNGFLSPQDTTNRAECTAIIQRYLENDWIPTGDEIEPPISTAGQAVVDYARQWISKTPYVLGGNSLTTGTDCSGFVKLIYANFGIDLPRPTWEQEKMGIEVAEKDLQPGDLIFFKNYEHVGIYSGNGKFIHTATSDAGTVEDELKWMGPIKTIRRVL